MPRARKSDTPKDVATITHGADTRVNIPSAEHQPVLDEQTATPIQVAYVRSNRDADPQLVWRGKDMLQYQDLIVSAPPLYIQEKIHPKVLIDDLCTMTNANQPPREQQVDLFADFNGLPSPDARTEFYQHEQHWSNRMILGDSLQVMGSLAEREGLRGKVQCIYFDPPYGIKFNSNFQWSTTSRDVKDGNAAHITREPEQVKAFRDTWRDGIHSYLTYLRDRLTVARDLLTDSGSIFVQIGDENVHRVRALLDEVFGDENFVTIITIKKTAGLGKGLMAEVTDFVLWYAKSKESAKRRLLFTDKDPESDTAYSLVKETVGHFRRVANDEMVNSNDYVRFQILLAAGRTPSCVYPTEFHGVTFEPTAGRSWSTNREGMKRLTRADRVAQAGRTINYVRFVADNPVNPVSNLWADTASGSGMDKIYVVQTSTKVIERCILMTTDPGDLVLDPTCGSGTSAYVAEQWGRRWITIDTSRVALALARSRIMGARYPYYLLSDSPDGQRKEADLTGKAPINAPTTGNIRHGFVYERVPHITLKSIANNAEIDIIWDKYQPTLEQLRAALNAATGQSWEEWQIPREAEVKWSDATRHIHAQWWQARIARQRAIDASIALKADYEFLYDKPYSDNKKVRVAGPFTVESVSPHRMLSTDDDTHASHVDARLGYDSDGFVTRMLSNLKRAGVQQISKQDRITFTALEPFPGTFICATGSYLEGDTVRRAAIMLGSEFGTVSRANIVDAAREASDCGFDVLITCAFSYEAHASEMNKLGRLQILRARMNADLHMAGELRETSNANLFVVFGDPDITLSPTNDGRYTVTVNGVDIYRPDKGVVECSNPEDIACWFVDDNYNSESFFVRHAYFLGANDPYSALRTTLKSDIDEAAWATLNSATSRPFARPNTGKIAVKVINHLGDEVMKVLRIN